MNPTFLTQRSRETIGWVDALRVIAVFLVVFAHCCDAFVGSFDTDKRMFLTGVFTGSLTRPCVPLFVMMTGVLLLPLPREMSLGQFWRKRIGRILKPLIFWSIVLPIAFWAYFSTIGASSANPMLKPGEYDGASLLNKLYTWVFNFNFDTVPLWYLYMLMGLYLVMPLLGAWLDRASRREVRLLLMAWGVSLFIPYLTLLAPLLGYQGNWGNMGLLGVCDWNAFGTFYYVSGFPGYLLLAYYLTRWPVQWSWGKMWAVCIPLFAVGYAITSLGYVWFQQLFPGDYAYLEIVWLFCGINVMMMTIPVFLIVQKANWPARPWLTRLAMLAFGIYLCHFFFVFLAFDLLNISWLNPVLRILLESAVVFLLSWLVCRLFARIPLLRPFIR